MIPHASEAGRGSTAAKVLRRVRDNLWPMLQQAVAAALSWWIADDLIDHHVPLFAPIATLVALNTPLGGRGTNTVRVLVGVITGVVVGDLAYALLDHGTAAFGLAVFAALLITLALDGERITMAQAAVGAVICVAAGRQAGTNRVLDALVGGAVALVFSQLLFPVHPVALLRRAESTTLSGLADTLEFTARELEAPEEERTARTWEEVRTVYTLLDELGRARADSLSVAGRTLHRRRDRRPLSREMADALQLDLLGNSCFTLVRRALTLDGACQREFASVLRDLSGVLASFAAAPGSRPVRRHATRWALGIVRDAPETGPAPAVAMWENVRLVVQDVLVSAGADAEAAERAVREGAEEVPLPEPPRGRRPFLSRGRLS
ncbi:aromatic acid exporter family protein [Streptomyces sp. NPDC087866]|uniref:FUSC family protein n=1 Tax=unclassified Streptomyces TaxID=2593676 RepID=UPI002259339C|nr:FUSC family protein [Streptomyces sp. NBC_01789]MCX4444880.1 FUSC family protein [Streptomyces sp. NBC_01789]